MTSTTLDEFHFPLSISLLRRVGEMAGAAHLDLLNLDPDHLIQSAEKQTGLHEWGDPAFLNDYRVLMSAIAANDNVSVVGKFSLRNEILRVLMVWLQMQTLLAARPEITQTSIHRPLFIVGLPRTGTTLLHRLFQCDPARRVAPFWQFRAPFPLDNHPAIAGIPDVRTRIKMAETFERRTKNALPMLDAIHPVKAHAPEECIFLLPNHLVMHMRADVPTYSKWFLARDMRPDYAYHKRQLQSLSVGDESSRWVLKAPFHLFSLPELFAVYPDAGIIHTHRDPKDVMGSWSSFSVILGKLHRTNVDAVAVAHDWIRLWEIAMKRSITYRAQTNTNAVYDLQYHDLAANPIEAVRRLYDYFGDTLSADAENAMRAMLDADRAARQVPKAAHRYDLAQFGLTEADIDAKFGFYAQYCNIPLERTSA